MKAGTGVSDTSVLVDMIWFEMGRMYLDEVCSR